MYKTLTAKMKDISKQKLIFVGGEEEYFAISAKKEILNEFSHLPSVILENASVELIQEELSTQDLFSESKVIVIENFNPLETTSKKKIEGKELEEFFRHLQLNEDHIVVFVSTNKIDKRKKITKDLIKISHFVECKSLTKKELSDFISYLVKKNNLTIPSALITKLSLYLTDVELMLLDKEFEKLSLFTDKITEENIFDLLSVSSQHKIFDLMDLIIAGKTSEAVESFDKLLFQKESEYVIYSFLSNQFSTMMKIKMIKDDGLLIDIPKQLNIHPFMLGKLESASRKYTLENLIKIQELLLNTDIKIKEGISDSKEASRFLILSLLNAK